MQRNAWKVVANWQKNNSYTKSKQFKDEPMGSVGELSMVCSQIVLKCLYLPVLVDLKNYGP